LRAGRSRLSTRTRRAVRRSKGRSEGLAGQPRGGGIRQAGGGRQSPRLPHRNRLRVVGPGGAEARGRVAERRRRREGERGGRGGGGEGAVGRGALRKWGGRVSAGAGSGGWAWSAASARAPGWARRSSMDSPRVRGSSGVPTSHSTRATGSWSPRVSARRSM